MATSQSTEFGTTRTRVRADDMENMEALDRAGRELFLRIVLAFHDARWRLPPPTVAALVRGELGPGLTVGLLDPAVWRSLDAMPTFLTFLFPWLDDGDARVYLCLANGDPLAAACLVAECREAKSVGFANVETALRCAVMAAKHPDPGFLFDGWGKARPLQDCMEIPWRRAASRCHEAPHDR
ncbi:hypothetical protein E2562_026986 [Oryza meyeriana var. granulata]|uniref:Uncharacterized protein n=1 Tax=Oryza meyeriana var. granulata TaxID=110450 RepID=A0A6G1EPQ7_9ORYZ|nr:hypothetical protein E2562_026986 [Oryza meyeriana var. granulata]